MTAASTTARGMAGGRICHLRPGGEAEDLGLQVGDLILSINGHTIRDVIDYQFYSADDELAISVERDGNFFTVYADSESPLGIEFADLSFDGIRRCANHCLFCFVDQLPPSLRPTLYVKDDDFRYSVMYGNFVTLTNLKDVDWHRLAEQHISPLHVSVHCTDTLVRRQLLGNPKAPDVLPQLRQLVENGLEIHAQIVLCPGFNDGSVFERTINDLAALYPGVRTVGVVPVAVRGSNWDINASPRRLYPTSRPHQLRPVAHQDATKVIAAARLFQRECRRGLGVGFVYLADEFYLLARECLPPARHYDGYPQYENGIGMARSLKDSWARFRRRLLSAPQLPPRRIAVACGRLVAPLLQEILDDLGKISGWNIQLVPVDNSLFGPAVTVSGLLPGRGVIAALNDLDLGDCLVLPRTMLDNESRRCIDDITVDDLASSLGVPVVFAHNVKDLVQMVCQVPVPRGEG